MDLIERKILHDVAGWRISVDVIADWDVTPMEADCYDDVAIAKWHNDEWRYVGVVVSVELRDRLIAGDQLWGIAHGDLGNGINTSVWDLTPAGHMVLDGKRIETSGSPLAGVVVEALDQANAWLATVVEQTTSAGWVAALARFDPNRENQG